MSLTKSYSASQDAYRVQNYGSGDNYQFLQSLWTKYRSENRSDVIRRPYPSDLFGAGTGHVVEIEVHDCSNIARQRTSPYEVIVAPTNYFMGASPRFGEERFDRVGPVGRLRAKIKDQNLNLAQTLAEYRQTADLFVSVANDVVSSFRSLRSGRALKDIARYFNRPRDRIEQDIANRWLQYQYGMKPLISDVYGSCESLRKRLEAGSWQYATVRESDNLSLIRQSYYYPDDCTSVVSWTHNVKLQARYRISHPAVKQLAEVGITNPLLLTWELIPYSFVFDWIVPVGDWLASLDALVGVSDFSYIRTSRLSSVENGLCFGASFSASYVNYNRTEPLRDLPLPKLAYKPSTSLVAVANGLALLKQLKG